MKKLLVIGAGIGQIAIVQKARNMGAYVITVSVPGAWPAAELADETWDIDIYDRAEIAARATAAGVDAVISDQNDLMMPTVAYVAEALHLPGNTFAQVSSYCNKNTFRNNCDRLGIPVPKHLAVTDAEAAVDLAYPLVVKPADSQSSIGVKRVDTAEELRPALQAALDSSKTHEAIAEEFFHGKELVCEGFIANGEYHLLAFADRKYFELKDLMIPAQTLFPSVVRKDILDHVLECEKKMAAFIAPSFAITHSEYLYNEENGDIRAVESALRGGGVYISSHLIPLATGIDANELLLKKALGISVDVNAAFEHRANAAAGYVCFYLREGIIESVKGAEEIAAMPFVRMAELKQLQPGCKTEKMLYKGARKGPILVTGQNRAKLEENIRIVQDTLQITVQTADGVVPGIIWA